MIDAIGRGERAVAYLHHLQFVQALLHQFLYLPRVRDVLVLAEGIGGSSLGVLSEVVGVELAALAQ